MGIYDVHATDLIEVVAQDLKSQGIQQPDWAEFVKSGRHRERAPQRRDWFYVRMASILFRAYKEGSIGTNSLRTYYGGKRNRGVKPHHFSRASGKVIRVCMQELEKQGLLKKERAGRTISGKGTSYLTKMSKEAKTLAETNAKRIKEKPIDIQREETAKPERKDAGKKGGKPEAGKQEKTKGGKKQPKNKKKSAGGKK